MPLLDAMAPSRMDDELYEGGRSPSPSAGRRNTGYAAAAQHAMSSRRPKYVYAHQHSLAGHPHSPLAYDPAMQVDPSLEALAAHTSTSVSTHTLPPPGDAAMTRKTQNRLAQREFRQRKQEYIRALECRVDLLSSDPPTQIDRLRWLLRQLMLENAKLRVMLGVVAAHIAADGSGGFLGAHAHVRRELEQFVFNPDEQRSLKVWDPHSDDNYGHDVLLALRVQSQLPPEASLSPVDSNCQTIPTLPDLRKKPKAPKRSSSGKVKTQDKGLESGNAASQESPSHSSSPSPHRNQQKPVEGQSPRGAIPQPPSSIPPTAPVVAAAAAAARAAPSSVAQGIPAWGQPLWGSMLGPMSKVNWPPNTNSGQTVPNISAPQAPPSGINNSAFAALYRASMSLAPPEPGSNHPTVDPKPPPRPIAQPQGSTNNTDPPESQSYVAMPNSPPTWWAEHSNTLNDQQSAAIFDSRA